MNEYFSMYLIFPGIYSACNRSEPQNFFPVSGNFCYMLTDGGKISSPTHQPHFTPQNFFSVSGTHFCFNVPNLSGDLFSM
jgi:hypothetical protein